MSQDTLIQLEVRAMLNNNGNINIIFPPHYAGGGMLRVPSSKMIRENGIYFMNRHESSGQNVFSEIP